MRVNAEAAQAKLINEIQEPVAVEVASDNPSSRDAASWDFQAVLRLKCSIAIAQKILSRILGSSPGLVAIGNQ